MLFVLFITENNIEGIIHPNNSNEIGDFQLSTDNSQELREKKMVYSLHLSLLFLSVREPGYELFPSMARMTVSRGIKIIRNKPL